PLAVPPAQARVAADDQRERDHHDRRRKQQCDDRGSRSARTAACTTALHHVRASTRYRPIFVSASSTCGVMKKTTSSLLCDVWRLRKKAPSTGRSPRIGNFVTVSESTSWK